MPTGESVAYVAAAGHRPLPPAPSRAALAARPHTRRPRPAGLDWDALRPVCTGCGERSMDVGSAGLCPSCLAPEEPKPSPKPAPRPPAPSVTARKELEAKVVEAYQAGARTSEVAERFDIRAVTVRRILDRNGVERRDDRFARPKGLPGPRNSLKADLAALGVTAREVKAWALREGLIKEIGPGFPPARVVAAYAAAHPTQETDA